MHVNQAITGHKGAGSSHPAKRKMSRRLWNLMEHRISSLPLVLMASPFFGTIQWSRTTLGPGERPTDDTWHNKSGILATAPHSPLSQVGGNHEPRKPSGTIYPMVFAPLGSLCLVLVILTFQTLQPLYGDLWSAVMTG